MLNLRAAMKLADEPTAPHKRGEVIEIKGPSVDALMDQIVEKKRALIAIRQEQENAIQDAQQQAARRISEAERELYDARRRCLIVILDANLGLDEVAEDVENEK